MFLNSIMFNRLSSVVLFVGYHKGSHDRIPIVALKILYRWRKYITYLSTVSKKVPGGLRIIYCMQTDTLAVNQRQSACQVATEPDR